MTIKTKLLAVLSLILLSSFLATSLINYTVTRDAVREELLNSSLPLTGKNIYSEIHSTMMKPSLVASSMANDTFLKDWVMRGEKDIHALSRYLSAINSKYGFISTFFVSATTDIYYYQDGPLKKVNPRDPHDVWYYSFVHSRVLHDIMVDTNQAKGHQLTIFINCRVEDERGRLLGVTGVGVNMDKAIDMLNQARKEYGRAVYLVDQDGLMQVHPDKSLIGKQYLDETEGIKGLAETILTPHEKAVSLEYQANGKTTLLSASYLPEFEWHLIVEQDEEEALSTARHNLYRTLGVGFTASLLIIFLCVLTINHFQSRLERMAKTDPLTGIANRRAFEERFHLAAYKADRYGSLFSIIVIDLDGFKKVNDIYGHLEGDRILKSIASSIDNSIRPADFLARWGGDEFIVLMDGDAENAKVLADRIRTAVTHSAQETIICLSCGAAQYENGDDLASITARADKAMYKAKSQGGDRVVTG